MHLPAAQSAIGTAGADLLLGVTLKRRHIQWESETSSELGSRSQWSVVEVPVSKGSGVSDLLDYEVLSFLLCCRALTSGLRGSRISLLLEVSHAIILLADGCSGLLTTTMKWLLGGAESSFLDFFFLFYFNATY